MYTLGFQNSGSSGVALYKDDVLLIAITEERLNRIKNFHGFPELSIQFVLNYYSLNLKDIDQFCYGMFSDTFPTNYELDRLLVDSKNFDPNISTHLLSKPLERIKTELDWNKSHLDEVIDWFDKNNIPINCLYLYDHHLCHAAGSLFSSPFYNEKEVLCFTVDGKGSYKSSSSYIYKENELKEISYSSTFNSLGYFYGSITKLLGFKPERHEGKITGLAAYGDSSKLENFFKNFIRVENREIKFTMCDYYLPWFFDSSDLPKWEQITSTYSKEDIAAGCQKVTEDIIVSWIDQHVDFTHKNAKVCLGGGLFANVKVNQKIKELSWIDQLFVMPAMGDEGIPVGACHAHFLENKQPIWNFNKTMYLGPSFTKSREDIENVNDFLFFEFDTSIPAITNICNVLNDGYIIGRFSGGMEFGPRALCNRSILANARNRDLNDSLNIRLSRSEFMPFAPVIMEKLIEQCIVDSSKNDPTLPFMTSTFKVTKYFADKCPATVHIDYTARPQMLSKEDNTFVYNILDTMFNTFGDPGLVNTSFNIHEEPIVCTIEDALRTLAKGAIDVLSWDNMLVVSKTCPENIINLINYP